MSSMLVTCLGKKGSSYNYIISGKDYAFRGGSTLVVDESVMEILKRAKFPNGKPLFKGLVIEDSPEETIPVVEKKVESPIEMEAPSKPEAPELVLPKVELPKTTNMQTKLSTKKVQGKLI